MLRERLLNDFSPDDACPLGAQLSLDSTRNIYQSGLADDKHSDMVTCMALLIPFFKTKTIFSFYFNQYSSPTQNYAG